ncbi:Fc.00g010780.m01.CDS01 [Cosmosporella sp. VM-42]
MNFGAKLKEAVHPLQSSEATRGEVDSKTPGSFPVDDAPTPVESNQRSGIDMPSHERNKLHKHNHSRASADEETMSHGHSYKDSGVGLTDTVSQVPVQGLPATQHDAHRAATGYNQGTDLEEKTKRGLGDTVAGTTGLAVHEDQEGGLGFRKGENEPNSQEGEHSNTTAAEHPYWGDLPRGAGVYNTVVGRGSPEGDINRHQEIHGGEHRDHSGMATSNLAGDDPANDLHQRPSPVVASQIKTPDESQEIPNQKDSRLKEVAAGAGVAGVSAAGTYEAGKAHNEDNNYRNLEETTHPKQSGSMKEKNTRGVFQRDHKSTQERDDKLNDDRHAKNTKHEKESKLAAMFHRGGHNKHDDESGSKKETPEDKDKDFSPVPAVAATGIGGVATYNAASRPNTQNEFEDRTADNRNFQSDNQNDSHKYGMSSGQPAETLTADPTVPPSKPSLSHGKGECSKETKFKNNQISTDTAAGLEAGVLASQELERKGHDVNPQSATDEGSQNPTFDHPARSEPANQASFSIPVTSKVESTTTPAFTSHANEGKYNILASGTPSGVKIESEAIDKPGLPSREIPTAQDEHYGTKTGAELGVAGLGAAAMRSQPGQEKSEERTFEEEGRVNKPIKHEPVEQPQGRSSAPTTAAVEFGSKRVIHQCKKCGEDNDISGYFSNISSGN